SADHSGTAARGDDHDRHLYRPGAIHRGLRADVRDDVRCGDPCARRLLVAATAVHSRSDGMRDQRVRSPTIAFIGAGSTVFARVLLRDLFIFPELRSARIALMDIDAERLMTTEAVARRIAANAGAGSAIEATTDIRRALDGADYVINMIQVGGYRP